MADDREDIPERAETPHSRQSEEELARSVGGGRPAHGREPATDAATRTGALPGADMHEDIPEEELTAEEELREQEAEAARERGALP